MNYECRKVPWGGNIFRLTAYGDKHEIDSILKGPITVSCLNEIVAEFRKKSKYNVGVINWSDAYDLLRTVLESCGYNPWGDEDE
jgi:hypothetical protein